MNYLFFMCYNISVLCARSFPILSAEVCGGESGGAFDEGGEKFYVTVAHKLGDLGKAFSCA